MLGIIYFKGDGRGGYLLSLIVIKKNLPGPIGSFTVKNPSLQTKILTNLHNRIYKAHGVLAPRGPKARSNRTDIIFNIRGKLSSSNPSTCRKELSTRQLKKMHAPVCW